MKMKWTNCNQVTVDSAEYMLAFVIVKALKNGGIKEAQAVMRRHIRQVPEFFNMYKDFLGYNGYFAPEDAPVLIKDMAYTLQSMEFIPVS